MWIDDVIILLFSGLHFLTLGISALKSACICLTVLHTYFTHIDCIPVYNFHTYIEDVI